nr:hypothetical protein [Luminiphilus sp.]
MARRLRAKQWMAVLSGLGFSFIYGIASPQAQGLISLEECEHQSNFFII